MGEIKVYLAGGFHSGWQDLVKARTSNLGFFDPREYKLDTAELYTAWDLNAIRESDWVFAYLEKSNPGGLRARPRNWVCESFGKEDPVDR